MRLNDATYIKDSFDRDIKMKSKNFSLEEMNNMSVLDYDIYYKKMIE